MMNTIYIAANKFITAFDTVVHMSFCRSINNVVAFIQSIQIVYVRLNKLKFACGVRLKLLQEMLITGVGHAVYSDNIPSSIQTSTSYIAANESQTTCDINNLFIHNSLFLFLIRRDQRPTYST